MEQSNNVISNYFNSMGIKLRPFASHGIWVSFLLPLAIMLSGCSDSEVSEQYHMASTIASGQFGSAVMYLLYMMDASAATNTASGSLVGDFVTYFVPSSITSLLFYLGMERGVIFSIFGGFLSTYLYCKGLPWLLLQCPNSFTYGEAAIVVQSSTIFLFCSITNIIEKVHTRQNDLQDTITIILQVGMMGLCIIAISCFAFKRLRVSLPFYVFTIYIMCGAVVPLLAYILFTNPIMWIVNFMLENPSRVYVMGFWCVSVLLAIFFITVQIFTQSQASTVIRKCFHFLIVVVYIPGVLLECNLLYLSSGVIFAFLVLLEIMRVLQIEPLGKVLEEGFKVYADEKDSGNLALTALYLMVGCSGPLWIYPCPFPSPDDEYDEAPLLPLLCGVLATGVGDTAASICGSTWGRHTWPGTKKTIEGTAGAILGQSFVIFILMYLGFIPFTLKLLLQSTFAVTATSIVEALTDQVDNLVLPLVMYVLLMSY